MLYITRSMAKVIPLKTLGEESKPGYVPYLITIKNIVMQPTGSQRGMSVEEIQRAVRVFNAIDLLGEKNELVLEDADHSFVAEKIKAYIYPFAHENILAFINDIVEAKDLKDIATGQNN